MEKFSVPAQIGGSKKGPETVMEKFVRRGRKEWFSFQHNRAANHYF